MENETSNIDNNLNVTSNTINLNEILDSTIIKLNLKKEKYKNLATIWEKYILIRKEKLIKSIEKANSFLEKVDSILEEDVSEKTLAFLYLMSASNVSLNNTTI